MFTRDIKCDACGFEGKVETHDTIGTIPGTKFFTFLGKDSFTGFLHFRCPSCNTDLAVDPLTVLSAKQMIGCPQGQVQQTRRYVPIILGIIFCGLGLILIFKFSSIILLAIGIISIAYGLINLKIGFTASDKAIRELTSPEMPVSEETKEEIKRKL